jgi:ETC complex I subunit-like protein
MPKGEWHEQTALSYEPYEAVTATGGPPKEPRCSGGLSGRPSCRIYPRRQIWVMEIDPGSGGWIEPLSSADPCNSVREPTGLAFPTLAAAIAYAERHGFDYRVIAPKHRMKEARAGGDLPRSWRARLARNGRNGEIYHG